MNPITRLRVWSFSLLELFPSCFPWLASGIWIALIGRGSTMQAEPGGTALITGRAVNQPAGAHSANLARSFYGKIISFIRVTAASIRAAWRARQIRARRRTAKPENRERTV